MKMGYILPINHYQSSHYQVRMNKRKSNAVEKPYKVIFDKKYEDLKGQYDRLHFVEDPTTKGKYINEKC